MNVSINLIDHKDVSCLLRAKAAVLLYEIYFRLSSDINRSVLNAAEMPPKGEFDSIAKVCADLNEMDFKRFARLYGNDAACYLKQFGADVIDDEMMVEFLNALKEEYLDNSNCDFL